jgi:hypothetical protein
MYNINKMQEQSITFYFHNYENLSLFLPNNWSSFDYSSRLYGVQDVIIIDKSTIQIKLYDGTTYESTHKITIENVNVVEIIKKMSKHFPHIKVTK